MRKVKIAIVLASSLLICQACNEKKEDVKPISQNSDTSIPLKVGNYWVYDYYEYGRSIDTIQENYLGKQKITVIRDTIINDLQYFILDGSLGHYTLLKDKVSTILRCKDGITYDQKGDTIFSLSIFEDKKEYKFGQEPDLAYKIICEAKELKSISPKGVETKCTHNSMTYISIKGMHNTEEYGSLPSSEHQMNKEFGLVFGKYRYAGDVSTTDPLLQQIRYEKHLVDYFIQ